LTYDVEHRVWALNEIALGQVQLLASALIAELLTEGLIIRRPGINYNVASAFTLTPHGTEWLAKHQTNPI